MSVGSESTVNCDMLASKTGCFVLECVSLLSPLLVELLKDIDVEHLVVKIPFSVPACVVVTVLVMSPGCIKLPIVGDTGGDIKVNNGGPMLFDIIDIES